MATHFAAIRMTAILVHRAIEMPWRYRDVVSRLWPELTADAPEADRAAAALRYVLSWAHGHRERFLGHAAGAQTPLGGWAGRWDSAGGQGGWEYIGFLPHVIGRILQESGFEAEPIQRLWRDRDWLLVTEGKPRYRARLGAQNTHLVAIKREVIEQFEEPDEDDTSGHPFPRLVEPMRRAGT